MTKELMKTRVVNLQRMPQFHKSLMNGYDDFMHIG